MRAILLAMMLCVACSGDAQVFTEGDIINGVSVAFCERLDECAQEAGYDPVDQGYCVDHNQVHLCQGRDCEGPTTDERINTMYQCVEDMASHDCQMLLFLGDVPATCNELL